MTEVQHRNPNDTTEKRARGTATDTARSAHAMKNNPADSAAVPSGRDAAAAVTPPVPPVPPVPKSAGAQLQRAREANGWTIDQVAGHLKLAVRQVVAIENDDMSALPPFVVTRGFIRHYAKLVELDADMLLALIQPPSNKLPTALKSDRPLSAPFSDARLSASSNQRWMVWGGVLIVLVVLAGLLLESGMFARLKTAASQTVSRVENVAASSSGSASDVVGSGTAGQASGESTGPADSIVKGVNATATENVGDGASLTERLNGPSGQSSQPVASSATTSAAQSGSNNGTVAEAAAVTTTAPAAPIASAAAANSGVEISAMLDTWLEIRRPDNAVVFSGIVRSGEKKVVDAKPPLNFHVGNVRGVSISFDGQPVNMQPFTQGNVARFGLPAKP